MAFKKIYDAERDIKPYATAQLNGYLNKRLNNNNNGFRDLKGDVDYLYRERSNQFTLTIKLTDFTIYNRKGRQY